MRVGVVLIGISMFGCGESYVAPVYIVAPNGAEPGVGGAMGAAGSASTAGTAPELPSHTPDEARDLDLAAHTGQADLPETLCDEAFLSAGFELEADAHGMTWYVDALSVADTADGSRQAPFRTLSQAVAFAGPQAPATLVVAAGSYDDALIFSPGLRVLGGYDPTTWTLAEPSAAVSRVGEVQFTGGSDPALISELTRFRVEGEVWLHPRARVILQNNLLIPEPTPVLVDEFHPDPFTAVAVYADQAFLLARGNQLQLPTAAPQDVFSAAFSLAKSCARIVDNDIEAYRTPLRTNESTVAFNFNFTVGGMNGVSLTDSTGSVIGNYFHLQASPRGCTYAFYLFGSPAVLRHNELHLDGLGNGGLSEGNTASDPLELVANEFHLHGAAGVLYIDRQTEQTDDEASSLRLYDINQVNALRDIPLVSDNKSSFSR